MSGTSPASGGTGNGRLEELENTKRRQEVPPDVSGECERADRGNAYGGPEIIVALQDIPLL